MQQNKKFKIAIACSIAGMAFLIASGSIWNACIAMNSRPLVNLSIQPLAPSSGNWVANGTPICTNILDQVEITALSDGAGGMIMAWQDYRSGLPHIYAQHIDANGNTLWGANGMAICTLGNGQKEPVIVSDDAGGAIIGWFDDRTASWQIYAQHVDYNGIAKWASNGVLVSSSYPTMAGLRACKDWAGGAIFTWDDGRSSTTHGDIYAQRISSTGNALWLTGGVDVSSATGDEDFPTIAPDGNQGAIISWIDSRNAGAFDIYSQHVNGTGNMIWTAHGVPVCVTTGDQIYPQSYTDYNYGAFITWVDSRDGNSHIYAQYLNSTGASKWVAGGLAVCDVKSSSETEPTICADLWGGCIISWMDERNGGYTNYDIYAQRLTPSGVPMWTANGTAVCTASSSQQDQAITPDNAGGIFITWEDYRDNAISNADIYIQHVDNNGISLWPMNGRAVCTVNSYQQFPVICTVATNNSIVAWQDNRSASTGFDVYAQYVTALGHVVPGPMTPVLTTDATSPDSDGAFNLTWGAIFDAVNYGVYQYTMPITSINSSMTWLAVNYLQNQFHVSGLGSGVYYFAVTAVNDMGTTMSNVVEVTVQVPGSVSLGMFPIAFIFAAFAVMVVVINRRKNLGS